MPQSHVMFAVARVLRITAVPGVLVAVLSLYSPAFADSVNASDATDASGASGANRVRQQIEETRLKKQETDKELTLRQGAMAVSMQRVQELQKQLEEAQARAAAETAQVQKLQEEAALLATSLTTLTASLPQHEAADSLVVTADRISARLRDMTTAQQQLQSQLAGLRKSSVEWRSKAADAEQQIAAITAKRPELEKKVNETKAAKEEAEGKAATSNAAVVAARSAVEEMTKSMAGEEDRLKRARASMASLDNSVNSLKNSLSTLQEASKATGVDSTAAIQGLEKAVADFAPLRVNTETLVTLALARRDEQAKRLAAANAELEAKTAEYNAAVAAAQPLVAAYTGAAEELQSSIAKEADLKTVKSDGEMWQKVLQNQLVSLEPSLQKLNAEIHIVSKESLVARQHAEQALEPLGRFVSFSRHVAPILADRCVACHNTRSPGGRLALDTFSALLKGGESGAAVTAHQVSDSLLFTMIEDESMPKEADPLKPEEIAIIRQWIEVGAPLDAGLVVSADLFDVIPERSQPLPPQEYRVAIPVTAVAFSPDGSQLASSGYHEVLIWNTADGKLLRRITNVAERVYDLEYSADGGTLAVAAGTPGQLGELKLFSSVDGTLLRTLVRSRDAVFALSYSPDGARLACAGADRSISIVDLSSAGEPRRIEDHADWVMDINWSPDGSRLVSSSRDKTCKVFDAATGNPVVTFSGHGEPVYTAAFLADGKTVASGGGDKRVRIWNTGDAKEARAIGGFAGDVFRIQVLAGDMILSASGDRSIHLHKAADGAAVRKFSGHNDWVYTVSAFPGGKLIASGSYDGEIRFWNSEDGTLTSSFIAVPAGQQSVASTQAN